MRRFDSPVFGEVVEPSSIGELLAWLEHDHSEFATETSSWPYIWRGQADINWPVHSTAYRRLVLHGKLPTEDAVSFYEQSLLEQARHHAHDVADGHTLTDIELLARLRHHGAATRLIDATRSALVGLWFAVAELPDAVGALIGVHTHSLGGYERSSEDRPYKEILEALVGGGTTTWEPSAISPRVAAQHSQFLFSVVTDQSFGSLAVDSRLDSMVVVAITPRLKDQLLDTLSRVYDISRMTLFPDVDGFGRANAVDIPRRDMWRW